MSSASPSTRTTDANGPDDRMDRPRATVTVLAGGFGGAKMGHGLALAAARRESGPDERPIDLTIIVNTGDDLELHGLSVCPDLDTVMYTLAGLANDTTGWGVQDETWNAAAMLERYGAPTWFRLGDRDLGTHIRRTEALRGGARLTDVTLDLAASLGVGPRLLPMADEPVRTRVRTDEGWLDFQDYFVRRGQRDRVLGIARDGIERARPTPESSTRSPERRSSSSPRPTRSSRSARSSRCPGRSTRPWGHPPRSSR